MNAGFSSTLDLSKLPVATGRWVHFVYRRKELYDQVWAVPMVELAPKYLVTSVALAKTCRRLRVPVPGRGYWAKIRAGQKPARTPLGPKPSGVPEELTYDRWVAYTDEERRALEAEQRARLDAEEKARRDAEEEKRRVAQIGDQVERWRLARDIRGFVAEGQRIVLDGHCKISKGGPLEEEFEWALDYANRIDPFRELRESAAQMAADQWDREMAALNGGEPLDPERPAPAATPPAERS